METAVYTVPVTDLLADPGVGQSLAVADQLAGSDRVSGVVAFPQGHP